MAIRDTDGRGRGRDEVQPLACKPQPVQNHHSFHLAHKPGREGWPWLDFNKGEEKRKRCFPVAGSNSRLARMGRMRPRPAHQNQRFPSVSPRPSCRAAHSCHLGAFSGKLQGRLSCFGSGPPVNPAVCQGLWWS